MNKCSKDSAWSATFGVTMGIIFISLGNPQEAIACMIFYAVNVYLMVEVLKKESE